MNPSRDPRKSSRIVKPPTQSRLAKPATQSSLQAKSATGKHKTGTGRFSPAGATGRTMARVPAKKSNPALFIGIGAGVVVLIIVIALLAGSSGGSQRPSARSESASLPPPRQSSNASVKREPTAQERSQLKVASDKIAEARRIARSILTEEERGKWVLTPEYANRQQEAKAELEHARQLCEEATAILDPILNDCGAEWSPDDPGMVMKIINSGLRALRN